MDGLSTLGDICKEITDVHKSMLCQNLMYFRNQYFESSQKHKKKSQHKKSLTGTSTSICKNQFRSTANMRIYRVNCYIRIYCRIALLI